MSFFKAYDMRGTFGVDFDLDVVYRIGLNLPAVVRRKNAEAGHDAAGAPFRVLVGRDARTTSPDIARALTAGLIAAGAQVTDLGPATTPMVYFFTADEDFDASVMVTASHNPPGDNGPKVSRRGALPVGYASGLAELERMVDAQGGKPYDPAKAAQIREATDEGRLARYVAWLKEHGRFDPDSSSLKFAVDCSDGMASILVHALFGEDAIYLNDRPDGTFPHHAPNPLKAEAREQIAAVVREKGLDCGVIFDGDADRCMFVDERGVFIQPDFLIPALAATFDERAPVIHDVRTGRAAIEKLAADGFPPVMGKVGHAFAKVLLRETKAICGGELAGHYYFRDFHFCDSGELAALRLLGAFAAAKESGQSVSAAMAPIVEKYANSGEINFKVADKPAAIARVLEAASRLGVETGRSEIDGYRLEYAEGWISVRQSNTEPYLRLIVECDTKERLKQWLDILCQKIQ